MTPLPTIYLASRSPRRSQLLREAGYPFQVIESGVDDGQLDPGSAIPAEWTISLAFLKARAAREKLTPEDRRAGVVLGADTIVVKRDHIIGQPVDAADAAHIIRLLRDGTHEVLTGCCLLWPDNRRDLFFDRAVVRVGSIPDAAIDEYIASGNWRGKAGAYNLAERQAAGWPITCEGDPATVMGLPLRKLRTRPGFTALDRAKESAPA